MMLTIDSRRCPFGCVYCFDRFEQYEGVPTMATVEETPTMLADVDVVYPACDVDMFARKDFAAVLSRCLAFDRHVSISTKAAITTSMAAQIGEVAEALRAQGRILKVGVSLSTRDSIDRLEPRTSGYAERLTSLSKLREHDVPTSLNLKPILAEVHDSEYLLVLEECAALTNRLLIGEEWLDDRVVREEDRSHVRAVVDWLPGARPWPLALSPHRRSRLVAASAELGYIAYESDLTLMKDLGSGHVRR